MHIKFAARSDGRHAAAAAGHLLERHARRRYKYRRAQSGAIPQAYAVDAERGTEVGTRTDAPHAAVVERLHPRRTKERPRPSALAPHPDRACSCKGDAVRTPSGYIDHALRARFRRKAKR
eukprot:4994068-Pleurochrysis_carterae.AAC.3